MDALSVAQKIDGKIIELENIKKTLPALAKSMAEAVANYEKTLAVTMLGIRNGKEFTLEGETVKETPTTNMERVAKGICWKEKLAADFAESAYKNAITTINLTQAQLNGYQSINRYLGET